MVTRITPPPASVTSETPPASDIDELEEWDHVQTDAIPLPSAFDELSLQIQRDDCLRDKKKMRERDWVEWIEDKSGELFDATKDFSGKVRRKMTVAEVIRQTTKGFSIKFIAVIGLTGVGKSSIIKTLTGSDVHVEHSISAGTTTFAMFPTIIDDQRYILIDTPGFNDENRSDVEIFEEILTWFEAMTPYCDLAGILYVQDITVDRFNGAAKLNLAMLQALCGEEFYKNVTIITTKWGTLRSPRKAEKREEEFIKGPWKDLIAGGTRVVQHRKAVVEDDEEDPDDAPPSPQDYEEARKELCEMMQYYQTSENVKPTIQRELRRRVRMLDTKAGIVLREKMNLPATPGNIDGDGNSIPGSPSYLTPSDGLSTQSQHSQSSSTLAMVHVVHHHRFETPTPPGSPNNRGEEERNQRNEAPKAIEEGKKEGWLRNILRAIRAFFMWPWG